MIAWPSDCIRSEEERRRESRALANQAGRKRTAPADRRISTLSTAPCEKKKTNEDKLDSSVKFRVSARANDRDQNDTPFTSQSFSLETRADPKRRSAGDPIHAIDACLLQLPLGRHHLPCHGPVEQRDAGVGAGQHLRSTGALQQMQRSVRDRLVVAQLDRSHAPHLWEHHSLNPSSG